VAVVFRARDERLDRPVALKINDPPLTDEAAWYKYSPTPGQPGPSVIEGHVDSLRGGPSVFFRRGALRPGDLLAPGASPAPALPARLPSR
jgi:hypothetical protein